MQVSWQDIGGLDDVIHELRETVILPLKKRELFTGSSLLQPPRGADFFTLDTFGLKM